MNTKDNDHSSFQLSYQYIIPYERMECHFKQYSTSNDEYDDCIMESFDLLLSAQACNMPYEKVIGKNIDRFCNKLIRSNRPCSFLTFIAKNSICSTLIFFFLCIITYLTYFHQLPIWQSTLFLPHFFLGIYLTLLCIPFIFLFLKKKLYRNICYYYRYRTFTTAMIILLAGAFFAGIGTFFHITFLHFHFFKLVYLCCFLIICGIATQILCNRIQYEQSFGLSRSPLALSCIERFYLLNQKRIKRHRIPLESDAYASQLVTEYLFIKLFYPLLAITCILELIVLTGYQLFYQITLPGFALTALLLCVLFFLLHKLCTLRARNKIIQIIQSKELKLNYMATRE
ncbi:hypothetical protein lbkm_2485 [Lachnospiraceae bacterium KM106-2]|nr:hypothetical protein lbkm_2485 [Lachnospiraceae bacterium KM106-2]